MFGGSHPDSAKYEVTSFDIDSSGRTLYYQPTMDQIKIFFYKLIIIGVVLLTFRQIEVIYIMRLPKHHQ